MRKFEIVADAHRKFETTIVLPKRGSKKSAGYDFFSNETVIIPSGDSYLFWLDVKVCMEDDEVLETFIRSSMALHKGLKLKNITGVIDADYYSNITNDGNIGICIENTSSMSQLIRIGDRIAQGIFSKYYITDDDEVNTERIGGIGSTKQ